MSAGVSAPVGILLLLALLVLGGLGWSYVEATLVDVAGQGLVFSVAKWFTLAGTLLTIGMGFLTMALQLAVLDNAGEGSVHGNHFTPSVPFCHDDCK